MDSKIHHNNFGFLRGGGETGERIRNFDWSQTSIGSADTWPDELKHALRLMINAPVAICIMWGKDYIQFYNDAFIPLFGKTRHPSALGQPVKNTSQRWPVVEELFKTVMSGETIYHKDSKLLVDKQGHYEECYFDVSYTPIFFEDGTVAGIQSIALETTDKVKAVQNTLESEARFRSLIEEAPVATALFVGRDMVIELANEKIIEIWGKGKSVLGKPLAEALPELKDQPFLEILDDVFTTGKSFEAKALLCELVVGGKLKPFYFDFTYKAVRDSSGNIYGVMDMAVDVTEEVRSKQKIEKNQQELLALFEKSPVGIATLSKDLVFRMANSFYGQLVGRKPEDILGKALLEALPEIKGQGFDTLLKEVIATGQPFTAREVGVDLLRSKVMEKIYVDLSYHPITDNGTVNGILVVATDVTEQITARKKVEESQAHLQLIRDTVPAMIFYLNEEQRYQSYNVVFMNWFGVKKQEAIGKTIREFIGEEAYAKTLPYLTKAYAGEQVQFEMQAPIRMEGDKWLSIVYTPHKNPEGKIMGIIVHATDITEHLLIRKKIQESELFSREVIHHSPVAKIVYTGEDLTITIVNQNMLQILGRNDDILGKTFAEAIPELKGSSLEKRMKDVLVTGETYIQAEEKIELMRFGKPHTGYYSYTYKALRRVSGEIYGMMATAIEITEHVVARQKIEAKEKELRDLITAAPIGICVVSGSPVMVEEVNDRFLQISGKTRRQYAKAPYWEVLYEVAHIFEPVLDNVFKTGIKYTTEESEMVLVRDGVEENIFLTFEYIPVINEGVVTKVIVMAVEVTHQVETRKQIEAAVIERTKELDDSNLRLKQSNAELEQFAYIASHDLQEPIRKISTFTQMLEHSIGDMSDKSKDYFAKIYNSTDRMTNLIRDVLAFSQITSDTDGFEQVDLGDTLKQIKTDFELLIEQKQALIEVGNMPVLKAIPAQMTQLFSNLLSNSLKYTKPGSMPVISITTAPAKKETVFMHPQLNQQKDYYHIRFSDNGIGFDQEHADRIFKIFQRLHAKTEFEGTGIGLSICRKIVNSHEGHISAAPGANGGAVFNILLPK